jgi:hypothetical protein
MPFHSDGILQLDGYTGYNRLTRPTRKGGDPIRVAHCWAHARRKLREVFDRDESEIAAVRHCRSKTCMDGSRGARVFRLKLA